MSLSRWQPLREMMTLRDAMDRLFDDTLFQPLPAIGNRTLPMDIVERKEELLVRAAVPGFDPSQIDISFQGDLLTISGTMREETEDESENYHLREYRSGSFQRSVRLPAQVNADEAVAECENGILTIRLPKAEGEGVKKIAVGQNGHNGTNGTNGKKG